MTLKVYTLLILSVIAIVGVASAYFIHKIEETAVLKNELEEAAEDEIQERKVLEIANRPDDDATTLLKRMREGK